MSDFVLWMALLSPFLLGAVVIAFELWRMYKAPPEFHEHCSAVDEELTSLEMEGYADMRRYELTRCEARRRG